MTIDRHTHDPDAAEPSALRRRLLLGGAVTGGLAAAAAFPTAASARTKQAVGALTVNVEETEGWLLADLPSGGDDTAHLIDLAETAAETGAGVQLRAKDYLIETAALFPTGTKLRGEGSGNTKLVVSSGAYVQFGEAVGGSTQPITIEGLRIDGQNLATTPLRIGRSVESWFQDVEVRRAGAAGAAVTIETIQNATFVHFRVTANKGGGVLWDKGVNNIIFISCVVSNNVGYNHWFRRTNAQNSEFPDQAPANIKFVGGLCEKATDGPNIKVTAGRNLNFISSQCSREDGDFPTLLMEGGAIGAVTWTAGQMRAASPEVEGVSNPVGVIAKVLNGTLLVNGGAQLISAATAFEVGDEGVVKLDGFTQNSVDVLYARGGTNPQRNLAEAVEFYGARRRRARTTELTSSTPTDVVGMSVAVEPAEVLEFEADLIVESNSPLNDLNLSWAVTGGATMVWSALGLDPDATDTKSAGSRALQTESSTLTVGCLSGTKSVVTLRGEMTGGSSAGTVGLQAARASTGGKVTIHPQSTMRLRRVG